MGRVDGACYLTEDLPYRLPVFVLDNTPREAYLKKKGAANRKCSRGRRSGGGGVIEGSVRCKEECFKGL